MNTSKKLEARALSYVERDKLIEAGLDPVYVPVSDDASQADMMKRNRQIAGWILRNILELTDEELNVIDDNVANELALDCMTLTIRGKEEEEKN